MAATLVNSQQLKQLLLHTKPVLVDFWAPWCPHCVKISAAYDQIADQYAASLEVVKLNMDDADTLWQDWQVELIPTLRLYVNGKPQKEIIAPQSKEAIEAFLAEYLPQQQAETPSAPYDMIVIGGGPAGCTAALYAARAGLRTLVIEKLSAGGQMALTQQIDNYPGFTDGVDGYALGQQMLRQAERFGAETLSATVKRLDLAAQPKVVETSAGVFTGRTIVLATGAHPRELGLANEKELIGRGVAYCAACDGMFYKDKTVIVVGGGNSAAADALLLSRVARKVMVVHRRDTLRATKVYHQPLMQAGNVEFLWNSAVTQLLYEDKLTGVRLKNLVTGEESTLEADGLFVSIGRKPASELVQGQLILDEGGYILADETTAASLPGVYAVGDVRTKLLRQVVTAVADGAMAVHMAESYLVQLDHA